MVGGISGENLNKAQKRIISDAHIAGKQEVAAANAKRVKEKEEGPDLVSSDTIKKNLPKVATNIKPVASEKAQAYASAGQDLSINAKTAQEAIMQLRVLKAQGKLQLEEGVDMHKAESDIRRLYAKDPGCDGVDLSQIGAQIKPTY